MDLATLRSGISERARRLSEQQGGRWVVVSLCLIVVLGVGLRSYYAVGQTNTHIQEDSRKYTDLAEALYVDHEYRSPLVTRDQAYHPGSPLFHAGLWYLSGGINPDGSRLVVALLGAIMIVCTYLLARRLIGPETRAGPIVGLLAAFLIAVYPSSMDYNRSMMNEPFASITLVAAVLAFLWAEERESPWAWALPGGLIGLTALFRPEALAFGVVLAALVVLRLAYLHSRSGRFRDGGGLRAAATLLLAMCLAIAPWTIRNAITLDRFIPVNEGSGNALFIGTYLPGDGDHFKTFSHRQELLASYPEVGLARRLKLSTRRDLTLGDILTVIARHRYPEMDPDAGLARMGREQLADDITNHPVEYGGVLAKKFWNMWGRAAAANPHQGGPGTFGQIYHWLVVALGLIGLVLLLRRRSWPAVVIFAVLLTVTVIALVTLAPPRRNVDLLPLVSALAAVGAFELWSALNARRRGRRPATPAQPAAPSPTSSAP